MKSVCTIFWLTFFVTQTFSQSGSLDKSFGDKGIVVGTTPLDAIRSIVIQKNGKIVAAIGGYILQRFNVEGSLDSSFGNKGFVSADFPDATTKMAYALALLPDDKIIAAGTVVYGNVRDIALAKYYNDGKLDSSFGVNGLVVTDLGTNETAFDLAVLPEGKIVVAGNLEADYNDIERAYVVRYNPDGSPDESFGIRGTVIHKYDTEISIASIEVQSDNEILIAGKYDYLSANRKFMVTRFLTSGNIDEGFGIGGVATLGFNSEASYAAELYDMKVQQDGKILISGATGRDKKNMTVARFTNDGQPDNSFGNNGYTAAQFENNSSEAYSLALEPDGKIISAGSVYDAIGGNGNFAIIKFLPNGLKDSSFATNGIVITEIEGNARIYGAALQDSKIVVGGRTYLSNPSGTYYALARYNGGDEEQNPMYVKIKRWLHHHGFTWEDFPGKNNASYYALQRSINGSSYNEIARLFNSNNQQQHSYTDAAPLTGDNYYRLAAVSAEGSVAYSNVIVINNNATAVKIYPNPVKNNLQIEGLSANEKTKLTITDFYGLTKLKTTINAISYNWNVSQLKQGNYILKIESGNQVITKKFIKDYSTTTF